MNDIQGKFSVKRFRACYNCRFLVDQKTAREGGFCTACSSRKGFTSNFSGIIGVMESSQSWVARHEGHRKPGLYALVVAKPALKKLNNSDEYQDNYENDELDQEQSTSTKVRKSQPQDQGYEDDDQLVNNFSRFDGDDDDDDEVVLNIGSKKSSKYSLDDDEELQL